MSIQLTKMIFKFIYAGCITFAAAFPGHAQERMPPLSVVTTRVETYPSLSPNGQFLIYSSGNEGDLKLFRLDLTSRAVIRLTAGDFEDSAATWSPDGSKIVFQREDRSGNRDLWEIDADGSNPRNLTNTPNIHEQHPRYAPDGSAVIFDSNRAGGAEPASAGRIENYEIYTMSLKDGALSRLTEWPRWDMYPSFSPDMQSVVWRRALAADSGSAQNFEIFVKNLRTGEETNLTKHSASDTNPHWSPVGDWIVFVSTRDGPSDVYAVRADGSGIQRLTTGAARLLGYARPSFSPDGTKVVVNRVISGMTDIVTIPFADPVRNH